MRGAQPWKTDRARILGSASTSAEDKLWQELRGRRLEGLKFVRQFPIGPFIVDFACREVKVVVEIDGGTHSTGEEIARDGTRSRHLESLGYRIFRAHNVEAYENAGGVIDALLAHIRGLGSL